MDISLNRLTANEMNCRVNRNVKERNSNIYQELNSLSLPLQYMLRIIDIVVQRTYMYKQTHNSKTGERFKHNREISYGGPNEGWNKTVTDL